MATLSYVVSYPSLQDGYRQICETVLRKGEETSPRGLKTKELIAPVIYLEKPHDALPTGIGRGVSPRVAAVEAIQLCGAFHDPELMVAASDHFEQFREPYTRLMHGAYGRRISTQGMHVVRTLTKDPDSRQAVVTLWDPGVDTLADKKDYPCTVALQFLIRDDQLICVTDMRSNDVWLGLAYDLFQFGQLQWTIANMLQCAVGYLVHRPVSLHAYEHNWESIENLKPPDYPSDEYFGFPSFSRAAAIGHGHTVETHRGLREGTTKTEDWYLEQMHHLFERKSENLRARASTD